MIFQIDDVICAPAHFDSLVGTLVREPLLQLFGVFMLVSQDVLEQVTGDGVLVADQLDAPAPLWWLRRRLRADAMVRALAHGLPFALRPD